MKIGNPFEQVSDAYIAGFIDGEGCLFIGKENPTVKNGMRTRYSASVEITNTHLPILERIQLLYPGKIYKRKHRKVKEKQVYRLLIHTRSMRKLIANIAPYIQVKKEELACMVKFFKTIQYKAPKPYTEQEIQEKEKLFQECRRLKNLGRKV